MLTSISFSASTWKNDNPDDVGVGTTQVLEPHGLGPGVSSSRSSQAAVKIAVAAIFFRDKIKRKIWNVICVSLTTMKLLKIARFSIWKKSFSSSYTHCSLLDVMDVGPQDLKDWGFSPPVISSGSAMKDSFFKRLYLLLRFVCHIFRTFTGLPSSAAFFSHLSFIAVSL